MATDDRTLEATSSSSSPDGWKERIIIPTLLAGIGGGGYGLLSKHRQVHGLGNISATYAANFAIDTGGFTLKDMKHIIKIMTLLVAISAFWIGLLQTSVISSSYTWLLPLYLIVSLGCYGLLMVGVGLMQFPTCPQEAVLLQQDIVEAKEHLKQRGVDVALD